jgi:outer membrane murein-binding lipoprotein Lpp
MKKVLLTIAGLALLASAAFGVANAQGKANGPFADVPTDHWAYNSVEKLRDAGIVIGYPDGTYGGRRAMTRYEFAEAIARLLANIPGPTDLSSYATKDWVKSQAAPSVNLSGLAKQSDLDQLRADVTRRLSDNEAAISALRDLVNQFAPELKQLGVDIAAANARIDALDKRVTALEEEVRRVKITGELNVIGRADVNTKGDSVPAIDQNGYALGNETWVAPHKVTKMVGGLPVTINVPGAYHNNTSIWSNPEVYNDFLLTINGRVNDDTRAIVSIDAGNYISWLDSSHQSSYHANDYSQNGLQTFNLYNAYITTPVKIGSAASACELGRFGTQFTPFTLRMINPDVYTYLTQTASGDVIADGAKLQFGSKIAQMTVFAGTADQGAYSISASPTGALDGGNLPGSKSAGGYEFAGNTVKSLAGMHATFGSSDSLKVGVTALLGENNVTYQLPINGTAANNFGVYGVDASAKLMDKVTAQGEFAIDTIGYNAIVGNKDSKDGNEAWWAGLGAGSGDWNIKADYKQVYTYFASPGYWGNIGSWINPTNIEGPEVTIKFAFSPKLSLNLEGDFYKGINTTVGESPLTSKDYLTRADGGIKWGISNNTNIDLGYEWVQWNLKDAVSKKNPFGDSAILANGKPVQQYITLGVGHDLSRNAAIKVLYQVDAYNDNNTGFYQDSNTGKSVGTLTGGTLIGQASVKF